MAYASSLVDDLSCSVCCDIFKDPVVLSCSHSFCKSCLQTWWTQNQDQQCPLCTRRSSKSDPPRNIVLKNLSEAFQRENADLCLLHGEKLKLFCLHDLEMACVICRDSEKHADHRFLPANEAAPSRREKIQKLLNHQKEKLNDFVETKRKCEAIAAHINVQATHTERLIQKEFEKFHQFLREEEESRITALRDEEKLKGQKMKTRIEELSKQIETISHTVTETEQQLVAGDISFLKKFKATSEKVAQPRPSPALPEGALLDEAKHLGNLAYQVWKKLEKNVSYCPVILDPNTAGPDLHLSEDLTSVRCGARQQLPENPERLQCGVLGSEPVRPGTTWEVEVGDSPEWEVGVSKANKEKRHRIIGLSLKMFWIDSFKIGLHEGSYRSSEGGREYRGLPVMQKLQRIKVKVDPTTNEMSFIDPKTNKTILSQRPPSLSGLKPFINSTATVPLRISPGKEL